MNPGTYKAKAIRAELGESQNGTPFAAVTFRLEDHDDTIVWYGYITDKTTERTLRSLRIAGWIGNDLRTIEGDGSALREVVDLVIQDDEYNGKVRSKVQWVNKPKSSAGFDKEALAKRLAAVAKVTTKEKPVVLGGGREPDESDLPFLGHHESIPLCQACQADRRWITGVPEMRTG